MVGFDDLVNEEVDLVRPIYDKYLPQKLKLLFNVTRSKEICDALAVWLSSFEGGMSKQTFVSQLCRLSSEDSVALKQLADSCGKRSITKQRAVLPPLPLAGNILNMLAEEHLFIAVSGREQPLRNFIRNAYQALKSLGRTYVLDLNDMKLEWIDKFSKGKSGEMLQKAKDAEFLFIVGFETPLDLPFYIGDTINTLRRYRVEHKLPIISTFARFRDKEKFFEYFEKYSVK